MSGAKLSPQAALHFGNVRNFTKPSTCSQTSHRHAGTPCSSRHETRIPIDNWSLTSLQLVKTGGRLVKHAR